MIELIFIVIGSVLTAVGRFMVPGHDLSWPGTYEAFAHIWVGVLLTVIFSGTWMEGGFMPCFENRTRIIAAVSLVLITLIEIALFASFKFW